MKNLFFNQLLLIFCFFITSSFYAQERTVTGIVLTLDHIAVMNAEVKVSSNKETVLTDTIGIFKVSCSLNDKLKISAEGFTSQKIKIDKNTERVFINLKLKPEEENLDIAVGYGHIKEKDKTYAITSIQNDDDLEFSKYSNIIDYIVNSSPSISFSGGGIVIRGESSLLGSSYATIIIDGIESTISQLSALAPLDVKSIDILKGSAAAIYGSRGNNGVVIITTKRGSNNDE